MRKISEIKVVRMKDAVCDVDFYFSDSTNKLEPFVVREFEKNSKIRLLMEEIIEKILEIEELE